MVVRPVLYNPMNDRKAKLMGTPKPLFLTQKYVYEMEILTAANNIVYKIDEHGTQLLLSVD